MKQKRDVRFIVLGAVILLFIAGCEGDDGGAATGGVPRDPFLGGTRGLEISFLDGLPPEEVTDGGTFDFQAFVSLKNNGEHEFTPPLSDISGVQDIKVSLIGFAPSDFRSSDDDLTDQSPLNVPTARKRGSEGNIVEPTEVFIEFPTSDTFFSYNGELAGNTAFIFRAEVCYTYQTKAVSEICVLENLINPADDAICVPSEEKRVYSSSSPLQVTSFRQAIVGRDKIQFSFDIVHSGSGDVFALGGDASSCPKENRRRYEDLVEVIVDTGLTSGDSSDLTCAGLDTTPLVYSRAGPVKLIDGRRTITCTQNILSYGNDFKKVVDITLIFNYLDNVDQEVLVKHLID